ncbi:hypothetical protein G9A89_013965 [Geosiphon pyriformis]|nr:hypothetical protein G9A89_013965 [Geosiphon pyriformis]
MAQDPLQQNILIALQGIQTALGQRNNTPLLLRTDLLYALWLLLALKDNPTMDMAIELAQRIEDNQRMHLEFILLVFAPAPVMAPTPQMAATSFAAQIQDPNEQLIDRLTANLA